MFLLLDGMVGFIFILLIYLLLLLLVAYYKMYTKDLAGDVASETGGDLAKLLSSCMQVSFKFQHFPFSFFDCARQHKP